MFSVNWRVEKLDKRVWSQEGLSVSVILRHHSADNAVTGKVLLLSDCDSVSFEDFEGDEIKES